MRPDASTKIAKVTPKGGPNPVIIGAVIAVLVILAVVAAIVIGNNSKPVAGASGSATPVGVIGGTGGGIFVNKATAKANAPTVDVYEDFQCPGCGDLEKKMGGQITSMAEAGQIKLVVHMLSFLDGNLKNDSSTRSANAASCAADVGKFLPYHSAVFAGQPAEEGIGYTDAQLTEFAKTAGISGDALTTWQKCTSSGQHAKYVTDVQTAAEKEKVFSTPTVKVNGKASPSLVARTATPDDLIAAVKAATR
jgi:protein-disulfide isomerase